MLRSLKAARRKLVLAACLTVPGGLAAHAQATATPASAPAPETLAGLAALPVKTLEHAQPTLDLLLDLKFLNDLLGRQALKLDAKASQGLRTLLTRLQNQGQLPTAEAQKFNQAALALLTPENAATLAQYRTEQEQKVTQVISRGAFAAQGSAVNQAALRYAFQVPGGVSVVWKVTHTADWNPFREAGSNATLLERLLRQLTGQY